MCKCHSHNGFLTRRGYEDAQLYLGVDKGRACRYLDKVASVSGLDEDEVSLLPLVKKQIKSDLSDPFQLEIC